MPKLDATSIPVLPSLNQLKQKLVSPIETAQNIIETNSTLQENESKIGVVNYENIKKWVLEFSENSKKEDRMIEFAILTENDFSYDNNIITLQLHNELEATQLQQFKPKLIEFLKSKSGNVFQIEYIIVAQSASKTLYSSSDKYNYIKEIVPEIEELKRRLGLELEH